MLAVLSTTTTLVSTWWAFLIKATGIYAEVAFNLIIPTLFALTVVNSFSVAYSLYGTAHRRRFGLQSAVQQTPKWYQGIGTALLAPLFVTIIGNLDGFAQLLRSLATYSTIQFQSVFGLLPTIVGAADGVQQVFAGERSFPTYDFWGPSRVIPETINEFPYWSFLFADLHPHVIGIPLAVLFLALMLAMLEDTVLWSDNRRAWGRGLLMLVVFSVLLGTLASVNLWELPTYLGLGVLTFMVGQYRGYGRINGSLTVTFAGLYLLGAYATFLPFFQNYANVGASGIGLVREPDSLGTWLLIWGFPCFILFSWLLFAAARPVRRAEDRVDGDGQPIRPSGLERWLSLAVGHFDRLPRLLYLHQHLVRVPTFGYLLGLSLLPILLIIALGVWLLGYAILGLCLALLGLSFLLLWRQGRQADTGSIFIAILTITGLAILAGTQIIYLKDFLQGGDWYRMNTLFKFFSQVWVIWGVAAAAALPRIWSGFVLNEPWEEPRLALQGSRPWATSMPAAADDDVTRPAPVLDRLDDEEFELVSMFARPRPALEEEQEDASMESQTQTDPIETETSGTAGEVSVAEDVSTGTPAAEVPESNEVSKDKDKTEPDLAATERMQEAEPERRPQPTVRLAGVAWTSIFLLLLVGSLAFPIYGTPARLKHRLIGWQPEFGTLNGLDYMREGVYTWPDDSHAIELRYDWQALQWLLDNVRGNAVIVESAEIDYYRAGGTRIASLTGLSGLRGMHEQEQRFSSELDPRNALHTEFWNSPEPARTLQIIDELDIALIYVGQLERHQHPEGVSKLTEMSSSGALTVVYENENVTIYAVPGHLTQTEGGYYVPS